MKTAYLGDQYSHSYHCAQGLEGEKVGYPTIKAAIKAVSEDKADNCLIPIENSVEGAVSESMDLLLESNLFIVKEINQPIHHCLIGLDGANINEIKSVYSHYQALSQCSKFIEQNLKNAKVIAVASTSEALNLVSDKTVAAIARDVKGGQVKLAQNIEDYSNNTTRFLLLNKRPSFTGGKVSIVFDAPNQAGALLKVLEIFYKNNINMTKIESRPHKSGLGHYIFYVDFTSALNKDGILDILSKVGERCGFIKFLGAY